MIVGDGGDAHRRERGEQRLRLRALEGEQPRLVRDVAQPHVGAALLVDDVLPVPRDVRRVDDHHHAVLEAIDQAIVDEGSLWGENGRVLRLPGPQGPHIVARHTLHEGVAVRPRYLELTHVRDVEQADGLAHGPMLRRNPARVRHGHLVATKRHHFGAEAHVDVVEWRALRGRVGH